MEPARDQVILGGAPYSATGTWQNGKGMIFEAVAVVEVLDIDELVAALLAASEQAILTVIEQIKTGLTTSGDIPTVPRDNHLG